MQFILEELGRRFARKRGEFELPGQAWHKAALELAQEINETSRIERRYKRLNAAVKATVLALAEEANNRYDGS